MRNTHLVEPDVVAEVRVVVELRVPTIGSPFAFQVSPKDVDYAMLDLFCDLHEVHVISASRRTLNLES